MHQIKLSLPQMKTMLAALRNSTKQFQVTVRENGSNVTFRARYSAAPRPVPVDTDAEYNFYAWDGNANAHNGVRSVPSNALVSLTINSTEYVLE
jgi:hypothetical protein